MLYFKINQSISGGIAMNKTLRRDSDKIISASIKAVLPDEAVFRALESFSPPSGRLILVAAGKAAWQMAAAARS